MKIKTYFRLSVVSVIMLLLNSYDSMAQSWFQPTDTWHYRTCYWDGNIFSPSVCGLEELELAGDTVLANVEAKIIKSKSGRLVYTPDGDIDTAWAVGYLILREKNDSVYYWRDSFYLIYDFTLQIGDLFPVRMIDWSGDFCDSVLQFQLDSVHTEFIAGRDRRIQYLGLVSHHPIEPHGRTLIVLEGVGMIGEYLSSGNNTSFSHSAFIILDGQYRCSTDSPGSSRSFCSFEYNADRYSVSGNCDSLPPPVSVADISRPGEISVSPNPFSEKIQVLNTAGIRIHEVQLRSMTGQEIAISYKGTEIEPLRALTPGAYVLMLRTSAGQLAFKVIKI